MYAERHMIDEDYRMIDENGKPARNDKRRHRRVALDTFVILDLEIFGAIKNLSAGSMCVRMIEHVSIGRLMHIDFTLPTGRCVSLLGNIVWIKQDKSYRYECGIKFIEYTDKNREAVEKYIDATPHDFFCPAIAGSPFVAPNAFSTCAT
jgi:hypothetical protein